MSKDLEKEMAGREHESVRTQTAPPAEQAKPNNLGYASHITAPGAEPDKLTSAIPNGFLEIHADAFPSKGLFYPDGVRFYIRSASAAEIRAFSTLDETSPYSIDEALANMMKACLMIKAEGKILSYKDLKEEDRIHIVLAIRDATFVKAENRLAVPVTCNGCKKEYEIEIKNSSFISREIEPSLMKYYSEDKRCLEVQTKSFGVITIQPPSVGLTTELAKYIRKRQGEKKPIDMAFIKIMPYLVADWRELNETKILHMEADFIGWQTPKFQFMNSLIDQIRVGVKDELVAQCGHCGEENTVQVTFPGGPKALFVVSDISRELL